MDKELDDILEHYGIKGMRWGVRRSQAELDRAAGRRVAQGKPVTKTQRVREVLKRKKVSKKPPAEVSDDARRAAELKTKAKKSGTQSLTNQQLKTLNERINLEQQYSRLTTSKSKGLSDADKKMIATLITSVGPLLVKTVVNTKKTRYISNALKAADIIDQRKK